MSSAGQQVFDITELLELILLNVPPRDVLGSLQRVSKKWKGAIDNSPRLQYTLYLRGIPASSSVLSSSSYVRYTRNKLAARYIPWDFGTRCIIRELNLHNNVNSGSGIRFWTVEMHDFLARRWLPGRASWQQMHISQPPMTMLNWHVKRSDEHSQPGPPGTIARFIFEDGIRMRDLYDLISGAAGFLEIKSPGLEKVDDPKPLPRDATTDEWVLRQVYAADANCELLINQNMSERCNLTDRKSLLRYHRNLIALYKLERKTEPEEKWEYVKQTLSTRSAMKKFLHAVQEGVWRDNARFRDIFPSDNA